MRAIGESRFRRGVLRRLLREARPYRRHLLLLALIDLTAAPLALLLPVPLKVVVDSVLGHKPVPRPLRHVLPAAASGTGTRILVAAAVLQVVFVAAVQLQGVGAYVLRTYIGENLTLRFRARLFRHVQRLSLAFHDRRGTADSLYRIQYDGASIQWIVVYGLMQLVSAAATLTAMVYVTARIDWQLAVVALGVCPPLLALNGSYNRRMRPRYKEAHRFESAAMSVVQEVLSAFRVVSAFGREDAEQERFVRSSSTFARQQIRLSLSESLFGLLVNLTTAVGTALVLYLGVRHVQQGLLTLGDLLLVMAYLAQLYTPLTTVSQQLATLQTSLAGAERSFELLDEVPDVRQRPGARRLDRVAGAVEFRDVSFSYDGRRSAVDHVSFSIAPATRLGLAGPTGSGKTTLVNLLARFYDPTSGTILLDGVDLQDLNLADLRNQFAIVLQEPVLFSASVAENIAYARPGAKEDQIRAAAAAANADGFIEALPAGYETVVGERGMTLSGGERQRISLARAFLKDAPILILDEPTSSVDVATEAAIIDVMDRLMQGRTTIMIAHRLGTLEVCDRVLELRDGRVVERDADGPSVRQRRGTRPSPVR